MSYVYVRVWALFYVHSFTCTQAFRRALSASVDSCEEVKWCNQLWQSLEKGAGKRCLECGGLPLHLIFNCFHRLNVV